MDKDTTTSTFFEYLKPLNLKEFLQDFLNLDRYTKKLTSEKWIQLMILGQLNQIPSQKQLALRLQNDETWQQAIDLESISDSQLSRKQRVTRSSILNQLFANAVGQIKREIPPHRLLQTAGAIYLVDASIIPLCLSLCEWATYRPRQGKAGVKIHMRVACLEDGACPDDAVLQPAIHSDRSQMNELVTEKGALYLYDRGYNDYEAFDRYCEPETALTFVTRLKSNAIVNVIEEIPVDPDGPITRGARVRLGGPQNQMKHELRLIETHDSEGNLIRLITNEWDRPVEEIGELYRKRWQIELFFKWAKQHLQIKKFYGTSENAVYNQIWIALITYCLLRLIKARTGREHPLFRVFQHVRDFLFQPFTALVKSLHRKPARTSQGRQRTNPEKEFRQFVEIVEKEGMNAAEALYAEVHDAQLI